MTDETNAIKECKIRIVVKDGNLEVEVGKENVSKLDELIEQFCIKHLMHCFKSGKSYGTEFLIELKHKRFQPLQCADKLKQCILGATKRGEIEINESDIEEVNYGSL